MWGEEARSLLAQNGAPLVNGFSNHVHDASERLGPHGDHDGRACVHALLPSHQSFRTVHGNGADRVLPCAWPIELK